MTRIYQLFIFLILFTLILYSQDVTQIVRPKGNGTKVIFLHHSTGHIVWKEGVVEWFNHYRDKSGNGYQIDEQYFPKGKPYPWNNYPYDYWNIWVNHAGSKEYMEEPTLEILTQKYNVIIFKHCFPGSAIKEDVGKPDVTSMVKTLGNYKLQYEALKRKLHSFPNTRFIVWTNAALVKNNTSEESAKRARKFVDWVKNKWDEQGDNIFIWDFFEFETEGGIYLKEEYAVSPNNSHPNNDFAHSIAPFFCQRIVDIIEGKGDSGSPSSK